MSAVLHIPLLGFYEHDAIGNFTCAVAARYRAEGRDVRIYASHHSPGLSVTGDYETFFASVRPEDTLFYQLSGNEPALERLMDLPCKKVIYYHNITPGSFFAPWHPALAKELDAARQDFPLLARADAVFANSAWSLEELLPYLPERVYRGVMPPLAPSMMAVLAEMRPVFTTQMTSPYILVTGRLVPHKNIEGAIRFFGRLHHHLPHFSLKIMGSDGGLPGYGAKVRETAALGEAARNIIFLGELSDAEKDALFDGAAAFLCASHHEGFGVPLVEAMARRIPIIAFAHPAVRETLENAGLIVEETEEGARAAAKFLNAKEARKGLEAKQAGRFQALWRSAEENSFWSFLDVQGSHL